MATQVEETSRFEQLRKLTEISRALTYTTAVDQILRFATASAADLLHGDRVLLMLLDSDGLLRVSATHGVDPALVERFREPLDENLGTRVQGVLGVSADESFIGVPLVAGGAVKGLLGVVRKGAEPCSDEEEWLLSAVADQVSVALENARLESEVMLAANRARVAREDAAGAGDAKDRALATLSHDLRSPLNAIDSYAELMEMEILGPLTDRQRQALGRIRMSGRHLLGVLQNVLEMARIEAGVVNVTPDRVDLAGVVDEALLMIRPSSQARGQEIHVSLQPGVTVSADSNRLRQVLINLLGNAVKYTPEGGRVSVDAGVVEHAGRRWGAIAVSDTGPGIPSEALEAIFRPYYRIQRGDDYSTEGAGLGLAISRELVRQMGGEVEVESTVNEGSTFTIRVPLVESGRG